jgi:hypothetical protein
MTVPVIDDKKVTTEQSKGVAGLVSSLIAILGLLAKAYPGAPFVGAALKALGFVGEALPALMIVFGMIYASASSAVPWIRNAIPWKKIRVTVIQSGGGL